METYTFKQTYPAIWIISFILTIFIGVALIFALLNIFQIKSIVVFIVAVILVLIFAFILPNYTATSLIDISLDNIGIKKKITKGLPFQQKLNEVEIAWVSVTEYFFQPNRQFDKFSIILTDGSKFKFFHNNDSNRKDDFLKFVKDFEIKIKEINSETGKPNSIKKGKTIYETGLGLLIAGFAILLMIGFPIVLILFKTQKTPNYAAIAGVYIGAIFYLTQVVIHRSANKK